MDEGRKRLLLIAASIVAARRLADWNGGPPPPKSVERIMRAIDDRRTEKRLGRPITAGLQADQVRKLHGAGVSKSQIARRLQSVIRRLAMGEE